MIMSRRGADAPSHLITLHGQRQGPIISRPASKEAPSNPRRRQSRPGSQGHGLTKHHAYILDQSSSLASRPQSPCTCIHACVDSYPNNACCCC